METPRRGGLRVRLFEPSPKESKRPSKSNAQRSKEYREKIKQDPVKLAEYKEKYTERNRTYRQKTVTEDELKRRQELNRIRVQKFRAKQKKTAQPAVDQNPKRAETPRHAQTRFKRQQEEAAVAAKRAQWRKYKQAERERWTSQKKRRNRERSLAQYHAKKNPVKSSLPVSGSPHSLELQNEDVAAAPPVNKVGPQNNKHAEPVVKKLKKTEWAEKKAVFRAKQAISKFKPNVLKQLLLFITKKTKTCTEENITLSEAEVMKENVEKEIEKLKPKRSKESLKTKKILLNAISNGKHQREVGTYKRTKSEANIKLQEFLNDVSINLPGKKTVGKKTLTQKKILPKRVRHLQKEYRELHPQLNVSRSTFYRNIPKDILTSHKHKHHSCLCENCASIDLKLDALNKQRKLMGETVFPN